MIVPEYWARARKQARNGKRQVTVHRYGWSDTSSTDAMKMAEARVEEALQQILSGASLERRESLEIYNGANGIPIREEVISRHEDCVISRNAYGARCLNTPNVLFADVDFEDSVPTWLSNTVLIALLLVVAIIAGSAGSARWLFLGLLALALTPVSARLINARRIQHLGGHERIARDRIEVFLRRHPDWNLRIYRSPNGMRLLATHQRFDPASTEVSEFFKAVGTDPVYSRMCINQKCFRARLSAKPWRIGISRHMRPYSGSWPVPEESLPARTQWIADYEAKAASYAACQYIDSLGSGRVSEYVMPVVELHDQLARACASGMNIA